VKRALITGHRGFVGRQFMRHLTKLGWDVDGIDITAQHSLRNTGRDIPGDCRQVLHGLTRSYDLVVHLAALVGGRATIDGQPLKVAMDLSIDAEFFNWAVNTKQKRVVYYSSSAAYPIDLQRLSMVWRLKESDIDLDEPRKPDATYGWAKLTGEMLARHAREAGVKVHVLRPFSGYGEDQDLCYPFPAFVKRALGKPAEFDVWGSADQVRDFIHIEDVVEGTMAVVDNDVQDPINLGWGRPTSMRELAELVMATVGHRVPVKVVSGPLGVMYRCCDPEAMLNIYRPRISLEEGVARAMRALSAK
jgi:nucleoside-diphosphate-sugar epimerase